MTTIRPTRASDANLLPAIEQSAGEAFRAIPDIAWVADDANHGTGRHRSLIAKGAHWVAVDAADKPIAFLMAEVAGDDLHIWELAVHLDHQGTGIGTALLDAATTWTRDRGLASVTLTTFTHVPWNAPWYGRTGFVLLNGAAIDSRLAAILRDEIEHGLPEDRRCAMRLTLR